MMTMMDFLPSVVSELHHRDGKLLGSDYIVTDHDVLCGRGKMCFFHPGNIRYRDIVLSYVPAYQHAITKYQKTCIINEIINIVRSNSPDGGFIRKDLETNNYFEVGDYLAHEKTSQAFRDAISTTSKMMKKRVKKNNNSNTLARLMKTKSGAPYRGERYEQQQQQQQHHHSSCSSSTPTPGFAPASSERSMTSSSSSCSSRNMSPSPLLVNAMNHFTNKSSAWKTTSCNNEVPGAISYTSSAETNPFVTISPATTDRRDMESSQFLEVDMEGFDQCIDEYFSKHTNVNKSTRHNNDRSKQRTNTYDRNDAYTFDLLLQFSDKFQANKKSFLKY